MKTIFTTLLIFSVSFAASAQKKVTDTEFEGFKGAVKSVVIEYEQVRNSDGAVPDKKRAVWAVYFFEKDGRQTEAVYENAKLVYAVIDGFKTLKSYEIQKRTNSGLVLRGTPLEEQEPIEATEKLVSPDERFDFRYTYEYDSQGRVKMERQYGNNGRLHEKREFRYDDQGRIVEEIKHDRVGVTKYISKYDSQGNLSEQSEDRAARGQRRDSKLRRVFSEYKLDAQGNWIERKQTLYFKANGERKSFATMNYRTFVYY